ncbi:Chromosome partition protein Smc [Calycomorphotria hydatis]|uniref:Chromosome partition protein Smc n=2 Tax=Calycomorphotria hydatis TaxID=2528027 RepID=A0A517TCT0_9PLAN|nr:Chromosome partition protein Smc [Calycomorphotria hydatis]
MIAPHNSANEQPQPVRLFWDLAFAIWHHRIKALVVFATLITLVLFGIMIAPREYKSESKLFVKVGRESITLDPTATTGQTISVYESRESELNSVLDVLGSRVLLEDVVASLGTDVILHDAPVPTESGDEQVEEEKSSNPLEGFSLSPMPLIRPLLAMIGLSDPYSREEQAVLALDRMVSVSAGKKSSVVVITAKAGTPQLAQRIVEEMVRAFKRQHVEIHHTEGSQEFFAKQSQVLREQLEDVSRELRDEKNRLHLVTVEGKRHAIEQQLDTIDSDVMETEKQLAASEAEIASLRGILEDLPGQMITQRITGAPNSAADQIRRQVSELRIRAQTLTAKYTETHPAVQEVKEQIERAEEQLETLKGSDSQQVAAVHPGRQQLELKLLQEQTNAESLRARRDQLRKQLVTVRKELAELNSNEAHLVMLEQRRSVIEASFRDYNERYEQARIDLALEDERITNVSVFQPASFEPKPIAPKKSLIFAAGFLFSVFGALATALVCEFYPLLFPSQISLPKDISFPSRKPALQEA